VTPTFMVSSVIVGLRFWGCHAGRVTGADYYRVLMNLIHVLYLVKSPSRISERSRSYRGTAFDRSGQKQSGHALRAGKSVRVCKRAWDAEDEQQRKEQPPKLTGKMHSS